MLNKYKILREKMVRFNEWERTHQKSLSLEVRMEQFRMLYETKMYMSDDVLERAHREHLASLIKTQRRLKRVKGLNDCQRRLMDD